MPQLHTAASQWLVSRLINICEVKQHRGYSMKGCQLAKLAYIWSYLDCVGFWSLIARWGQSDK